MLLTTSTLLVLLIASRVLKLYRGIKTVDYLPGIRCLFAPMSLGGAILPNASWNPGLNWTWLWRSFIYKLYGSDTISVVPYLAGSPAIYTISIEVAQQVLSGGPEYIKAPESTQALLLWGDNVISSNKDVYKRHRRIVGPAFASGILALVWEETAKTYQEMMTAEGWSDQNKVTIDYMDHYVSKLGLTIISRCGFGLPFPWSSPISDQKGQTVAQSLAIVSQYIIARIATPRWLYALPIKKLREIEQAYRALGISMRSLISSRREELADRDLREDSGDSNIKADLLTRLVSANGSEGKLALSDTELIGNVFSFMFAGNETTAHAISATLGLLAIHPEEQEKAFEQITTVLADDPSLSYASVSKLDHVLGCFQEATRLFPPGFIVTRDTTTHVTITSPTDHGQRSFVLPPGVRIVIDMIGLHYNPRYFKDPETFNPSRWYGVEETDLSFFGFGPRACLGKKFAMTEGLCFLTLVLRDWKVSPVLKDGETYMQWRGRVLQGKLAGLSFGIQSLPLTLTRRR